MQDKEKMFLDLNSVLVKFWIKNKRLDKTVKIELLERMLNWYKKMGYVTLYKQEEKKLPEGLEEAAEEHAGLNFDRQMEYKSFWNDVDTFKAGAEWQKKKMMKDAEECIVMDFSSNLPRPQVDIRLDPGKYHTGDKVKIIVIKED